MQHVDFRDCAWGYLHLENICSNLMRPCITCGVQDAERPFPVDMQYMQSNDPRDLVLFKEAADVSNAEADSALELNTRWETEMEQTTSKGGDCDQLYYASPWEFSPDPHRYFTVPYCDVHGGFDHVILQFVLRFYCSGFNAAGQGRSFTSADLRHPQATPFHTLLQQCLKLPGSVVAMLCCNRNVITK
jgi:hypothetical protein